MITQDNDLIFASGSLDRKVAIIVPLHNYARYITETLDTVLGQTFRDCVVIVVDDCSTDNSLAVTQRWMQHNASDLSFALYHNHVNARLAITRNTGIERAQFSEYCFFLDADNHLYPRCIEKHVGALDSRLDAIAAHGIIEQFGDQSGVFGSNVHARERLRGGNYIDAMAMFRRDALIDMRGYRNIRHGWEDYDVWLRMSDTGQPVLHIPEILSRYRVHGNSMLRTETNVGRNIRELHKTMAALHPWLEL